MEILFITTTNLSTNPRILKELRLALERGYECTFIGFKLGNWSDKTEQEHLNLFNGLKVNYLSSGTLAGTSATLSVRHGWLSVVRYRWLSVVEARYLTTLVWKLSIIFNKIFKKNIKIAAYAHNKRSFQIERILKKQKDKYDLIIAHNLGALYPTFKFAKKHHIPFAFDIEDYHPGEKCSPAERYRREILMQELLPKAAYISYASPLIGEHTLKLLTSAKPESSRLDGIKYMATGTKCISRSVCGTDMLKVEVIAEDIKLPQSILINNSFSQDEFQLIEIADKKVQFVWFSQNITWGRGLELIVPALLKYKEKVHLSLIGNKRIDFYNQFLAHFDEFITYIEPLPQDKLHLRLSEYDIGLAIEVSNVDLNKDIALSNKIFANAQSGLFILATDTLAQKQFIEEQNEDFGSALSPDFGSFRLRSTTTAQSPDFGTALSKGFDSAQTRIEIGMLSAQSIEAMEKAVSRIIDEVEIIRANKRVRFEYANRLAWEHESQRLLNIWEQLP
ncbi:MAG: hypothetical protein P1P88_05310 [Bacteroidales bacterium]|nr:hypothetical protein [Bacteroidales bacterium]